MAKSTTNENSATDAPAENPANEVGADEVQQKFDEAAEKGYFGETPDETPNENYTLQGVAEGLPTPETDRGKTDK